MEIVVTRRWKGANSTLSSVTVDGVPFSYILEDTDRGLDASMNLAQIQAIKIKGVTAIPTGRYEVIIDYSGRFKKLLPILLNVKGFAGIRIHSGNKHVDTDGCLLPGVSYLKQGGDYVVTSSRVASTALQLAIAQALKAGDRVFITVQRDYAE